MPLRHEEEKTDVLVIGAGTAGIIAAIQAGRLGVKTTVVEMAGQPGGTMANSVCTWPGYFHGWGRQVIRGIGWELVTETKRLTSEKLPDKDKPNGDLPDWQIPVNAHAYVLLAENRMLQAGVKIHYHETVTGVEDTVEGLTRRILARELIDCSGDADAVGMLGLARERSETRQPGTLRFQLKGYEYDKLDLDKADGLYRAALADGRLLPGDYSGMDTAHFRRFLQVNGMNQQHLYDADSTSSDTQTAANIAGHQALLRMLEFVRTIPGCENTTIDWMAPMTAIRETFRAVGEARVTHDDYVSGLVFADAVCYSIYLIDIHGPNGGTTELLKRGIFPTIPFGALIPRGSRRLLVAGRCVSSDRLANSALRVQPSCMAMGQVAGAAAAMAIQHGKASRDLELAGLRAVLKKHAAIVPEPD